MVALNFAVEPIVKSIRWQAIPVNDSSRPEAVFVHVTGWLKFQWMRCSGF